MNSLVVWALIAWTPQIGESPVPDNVPDVTLYATETQCKAAADSLLASVARDSSTAGIRIDVHTKCVKREVPGGRP